MSSSIVICPSFSEIMVSFCAETSAMSWACSAARTSCSLAASSHLRRMVSMASLACYEAACRAMTLIEEISSASTAETGHEGECGTGVGVGRALSCIPNSCQIPFEVMLLITSMTAELVFSSVFLSKKHHFLSLPWL